MAGHSVGAYVFTLCRIDGLALGAFIAILEQEIGYKHSEIRIPRGFIVATIFLFVAVCLSGGNGVLVPSLSSFLFALMVLAAVKYKLFQRPFEAGALTFLGLYSYGVYMYHLPLLFVLEKFFPQVLALTNNRVLDVFLFFAIGCGSSLLVAFLSYHLIEKHFLKLKNVLAAR
jgi:peptidoglycan/LPS O-acetylase OafA/YrhL